MIQQYVPINGDIRVLVLNGRVHWCDDREKKVKNDFRSNASLGANVDEADVSDEIKDMATQRGKGNGMLLLWSRYRNTKRNRNPFVLEVNTSPGSKNVEDALNVKISSVSLLMKSLTKKTGNIHQPPLVEERSLNLMVLEKSLQSLILAILHPIRFMQIRWMSNGTVTWTHGGKTLPTR